MSIVLLFPPWNGCDVLLYTPVYFACQL